MIAKPEILAEHLAGMVRFSTISSLDEKEMDWEQFFGFHKYLEDTYPLVHRTFKRTIVGRAGLVYEWRTSKSSDKRPVLLLAHQDVVPPGDLSLWEHEPFAGEIADGYVWGRGSLDCKNSIMGHMEALEALIAEGFEPDYDIYLAYGYNEEISTTSPDPAAKKIATYLKEQGIRIGVAIDEGGSIVSGKSVGVDGLVANVGLGEKGYADLVMYKEGKAGHTARPGKPNIMADVARAVVKLDEHPFPYRILPAIAEQYRQLAPRVDEPMRTIYADIEKNSETFFKLMDSDPGVKAKFQTTVAMTMAEGSYRPNIMPSKVSVRINCRPLPGETIDSVLERCRKVIGDSSEVKIDCLGGRDPSPMTDGQGPEFAHIKETIEGLYPGICVVPSICLGGTDAWFYYEVADHVFRFSGEYRTSRNGSAHGINERILIETIHAIPDFIYSYLIGR